MSVVDNTSDCSLPEEKVNHCSHAVMHHNYNYG